MKALPIDRVFPFVIFTDPPRTLPILWLQNPGDVMEGDQYAASEDKRVYVQPTNQKRNYNPLCDAALDLMERDLGGYPDRHDPLHFRVVSISHLGGRSIAQGSVYVGGTYYSGDTEGLLLCFRLWHFPEEMCIPRLGVKLIPPIKTSQHFNWDVLDDIEFERLMFRLFFEMNSEYNNVQWLQRTRATDSGRDISAVRIKNGNRILIQARHQKNSITAPDVNDVVVKAETWHPKFQEVIIVTTSTFTQEAIRWVENHNTSPGTRPTVSLEPHGHLEVYITRYPSLISHLGLRH